MKLPAPLPRPTFVHPFVRPFAHLLAPALAVALSGAAAAPAFADGTIAGVVRLAGPAPKRPALPVGKDGSVCGKEVPDETVVIGASGGLANVVVSLRAKPVNGLAPTPNAAIDQVGCRYTPHVLAVTAGTKLNVLNNDAVFHNVHAKTVDAGNATFFNVAMPVKGMKLPKTMGRAGVFKLRCDAGHTWMSAWVLVFPHPHFAVTDGEGAFKLEGVPPGEHEVEVWHEPLSDGAAPLVQRQTVRVSDGKTTDLALELKATGDPGPARR